MVARNCVVFVADGPSPNLSRPTAGRRQRPPEQHSLVKDLRDKVI
jgi:hypothetical protein